MNYKDIEKEFDDQYFISTIGRNDFRREKIKAKINSVIDDMIGEEKKDNIGEIDESKPFNIKKELKVIKGLSKIWGYNLKRDELKEYKKKFNKYE